MDTQAKSKTQVKSQNRSDRHNILTGKYGTVIQIKPKSESINLIRAKNKGKSPPGKARSPGRLQGLIL